MRHIDNITSSGSVLKQSMKKNNTYKFFKKFNVFNPQNDDTPNNKNNLFNSTQLTEDKLMGDKEEYIENQSFFAQDD